MHHKQNEYLSSRFEIFTLHFSRKRVRQRIMSIRETNPSSHTIHAYGVVLSWLVSICLGWIWLPCSALATVRMNQVSVERRPHLRIETAGAMYLLDMRSGGLSSLIDREQDDWIGFSKDPLSEFPGSAATGYRGIPNLVFGQNNPDAGVGHPGFDRCRSEIVGHHRVLVESLSGEWAFLWEFHDEYADLHILKAPQSIPYWMLYEGTIGGRFAPSEQFMGCPDGLFNQSPPHIDDQKFGQWNWVYFGDQQKSQAILIVPSQIDTQQDTFWFMGSEHEGRLDSNDGMVVFGFGRGPKTTPLLSGAGQSFRFGLADWHPDSPKKSHERITQLASTWQAQLRAEFATEAASLDRWRGPKPAVGSFWTTEPHCFQRYWFRMGEEAMNPSKNDRFRVNGPYASTHPSFHARPETKSSGMLLIPFEENLRNIRAARVYLELWGGHPHSTNRRVTVNGRTTYPIPVADNEHCNHIYHTDLLKMTDLVSGHNALQFAVDGDETFWGHFIVEEAGLDALLPETDIRIADFSNEFSGCDLSIDSEPDRVNARVAFPSSMQSRVQRVHFYGYYEGFDENGDGRSLDWHGLTKRKQPIGHLGTVSDAPFEIEWDVSMLPAQDFVQIRALAELSPKDESSRTATKQQSQSSTETNERYSVSSTLYFQTSASKPFSISHPPGITVARHTPTEMDVPFWSRDGESKSCTFSLPNSLFSDHTIKRASLDVAVWDGGRGEVNEYFTFESHSLEIAGQGRHDVLLSQLELNRQWIDNENTAVLLSDTHHHGIEILYPGPSLTIRYSDIMPNNVPLHPQCQAFLDALAKQNGPSWEAMGPQVARDTFASLVEVFGEGPQAIDVEETSIANVPCRIYRPAAISGSSTDTSPAMVYLHGGGWVLGDLNTHDALCRRLADQIQCTVISVDYSRSPESRYPTAVDEAMAVTQTLLRDDNPFRVDTAKIVVGGDSAGGNLALAVAMQLRDNSATQPANIHELLGQVLLYPVLDQRQNSESYHQFATGYGLTAEAMRWFWDCYTPPGTGHRYLSFDETSDFKNLPHTLVVTAGYDVLRDEGLALVAAMDASETPIEHLHYGEMIHGFIHFAAPFERADSATQSVANTVRRWLEHN